MKKIDKANPPAFFTAYIRRNNPNQWDDITPIRSDLRKHILSEQGSCCAYTEVRLPDHDKNCHTDHFRTRNLHPELTFEYTNLLFSYNYENCGAKYKDKQVKKKDDYTGIINPVEEAATGHIAYTFTGKVIAREGSPKGEKTIQYFNLNEKNLVERRKVVNSACLAYKDDFSVDEVVESIGEFETMIRQLYGSSEEYQQTNTVY